MFQIFLFFFLVNNVGCMYDHPSLFNDVPEKVIIDHFSVDFIIVDIFYAFFLNEYN